ncbi:hypothetical protein B0T21DRAFT_448836 [Apiosordaria backusii]|uniref:Uncharacterized protein n=1 Tax=Apiosordaria backusii TaxID=314023 RepID=A0AA40EMK3_9PEZI|nr:hypothetical protein B0T21DRAFT_448836 [Apiosordaria backusii]
MGHWGITRPILPRSGSNKPDSFNLLPISPFIFIVTSLPIFKTSIFTDNMDTTILQFQLSQQLPTITLILCNPSDHQLPIPVPMDVDEPELEVNIDLQERVPSEGTKAYDLRRPMPPRRSGLRRRIRLRRGECFAPPSEEVATLALKVAQLRLED